MALVLKDRVKETTTTAGTGIITLAGAVTGFQSFSVIGNSNTTYYCIAGQGTSEWEVGIGTYTSAGTTLARTTVLASSNSGSLVTFSAGTKDVFVVWPASQAQPFVYGESTAAPNNTVYVDSVTVNASSTDADIALVTKGTGATLAQVPDSATTGGNKRGTYATDWQKARGGATQVASGDSSFIGSGQNNTASGPASVVSGGYANTASNSYSTISGGYTNAAGSISSAIAGGYFNTTNSPGGYAFIGGGASNSTSALYASICGGATNAASGDSSFIGGGSTNTTNSMGSSILGGYYGTTRGIVGAAVFPACIQPISPFLGVTQAGLLLLGVQTTDATVTTLRSDANAATTTNQVILPNNSAYYFCGSVVANVTGGGNTRAWTFEGAIKRGANAAATTLVQSVINSVAQDSGAATWAIALAADTTNGGLKVTVTGQAGTTIRWVCKVETTEVTF
jgi:hypothetical protein